MGNCASVQPEKKEEKKPQPNVNSFFSRSKRSTANTNPVKPSTDYETNRRRATGTHGVHGDVGLMASIYANQARRAEANKREQNSTRGNRMY